MASATSFTPGTVVALRIGDVINTGARLWTRLIGPFGPAYVLVSLPGAFLVAAPNRPGTSLFSGAMGIVVLAASLVSFLLNAAMIDAGARILDGRPPSLGQAFGTALSRFLPLLGAILLGAIGIMLGLILLVVPGFIVMVMLYVVTPVCVLERAGPIQALKRSAVLTRGARWRLFGLLLIGGLLGIAASLARVLAEHLGLGTGVAAISQSVLTAASGLFNACLSLAAYRALADAKDGVGGQRVAAVFD